MHYCKSNKPFALTGILTFGSYPKCNTSTKKHRKRNDKKKKKNMHKSNTKTCLLFYVCVLRVEIIIFLNFYNARPRGHI